jgi:hypothetical protein
MNMCCYFKGPTANTWINFVKKVNVLVYNYLGILCYSILQLRIKQAHIMNQNSNIAI